MNKQNNKQNLKSLRKKNKKGMIANIIGGVFILAILVGVVLITIDYNKKNNPKDLCAEKNLDYFEKSCGFGCMNKYCIDDELNFKYEILYVDDDYVLKKIESEGDKK